MLSRVPIERVRRAISQLRLKYRELGLPHGMLPGLFYPRWPMNVWESLGLEGRVKLVRGEVRGFELNADSSIASLAVARGAQTSQIAGEVFVLAAGGLGSPILLQRLASSLPLPALEHAGSPL